MACSKFQAAKLVPSGAAARMENYEIILLNTPEVFFTSIVLSKTTLFILHYNNLPFLRLS